MDKMVINIGLPKTGTVALSGWLQDSFGVETCHHWEHNSNLFRKWEPDTECPFQHGIVYLDGRAMVDDWEQFLDETDAIFTVTHRQIEDRITSAMIHVLSNRVAGDNRWSDINTDQMRQEHRLHYAAIREHMQEQPDRFLWLESGNWDGAAIAEFLGVHWDGRPAPRLNTGRDRLQAMLDTLEQKRPAT